MVIINDKLENIRLDDRLSIALGTFDGVHRGHQKIIKEAVESAKIKNIRSAVLTFNVHPYQILKPDYNIKLITDNHTKAYLIESLGIDYVFFLDFNTSFAEIDSKKFIEVLKNVFNADTVVCGYNYTFGKKGAGNTELLNRYKNQYGFDLKIIERVTYKKHSISSSIIRKKIESGKIDEANQLLGYNYFYTGEVLYGKQLGNKLGFPTANIIIPDNLCLRNGVYITKTFYDGSIYQSISNVGYTPTVANNGRTIETHIIDFDGNLYGSCIKVEFLKFIREEKKFDNLSELKSRVLKDIKTARVYFINNDFINNDVYN